MIPDVCLLQVFKCGRAEDEDVIKRASGDTRGCARGQPKVTRVLVVTWKRMLPHPCVMFRAVISVGHDLQSCIVIMLIRWLIFLSKLNLVEQTTCSYAFWYFGLVTILHQNWMSYEGVTVFSHSLIKNTGVVKMPYLPLHFMSTAILLPTHSHHERALHIYARHRSDRITTRRPQKMDRGRLDWLYSKQDKNI